jgi:hypothetical protein
MFGKFQFAKVTALLDNLGKAGSQSQKAFQLAGASSAQLATLAEQELKQQTESVSGRFKRAIETLKVEFLPIGEKFIVFGTKILNVFSKVLDVLNSMGPLRNVLVGALGVGAIIGPVIMLAGLLTNLVGNLFKGAQYAKLFMSGFKEGGIKTALSSMTAYFEQIDIKSLAASENTDFLTKSAVNATEAFAVLNTEVATLANTIRALSGFSTQSILSGVIPGSTNASRLYVEDSKFQGTERPHAVSKSKVSEQMLGNISAYPETQTMISRKGFTKDQAKQMIQEGFTSQYNYIPGGTAAVLQRGQGSRDVIYGEMSSVKTKEEMFAREEKRLISYHKRLLDRLAKGTVELNADEQKVLVELSTILGTTSTTFKAVQDNPSAKAALAKIIEQTVMSQDQFYAMIEEQLRMDQMVFQAAGEDVKILNDRIARAKNMLTGPALKEEVILAWQEFESRVAAASPQIIESVQTLTNATMAAIMSANSTVEAAALAIEAQATIINRVAPGAEATKLLNTRRTMGTSADVTAIIRSPYLADGGYISGPGTSTSDSIPARLSNGEFVMNAKAVQTYGSGFMNAVNAQKFSDGGAAGASTAELSPYVSLLKQQNVGMGSGEAIAIAREAAAIKIKAEMQVQALQKEMLVADAARKIEIQDMISAKQIASVERQAEILQTGALQAKAVSEQSNEALVMAQRKALEVGPAGDINDKVRKGKFAGKFGMGSFGSMMGGQMVGMGMQTMAGKMQPGMAQSAMGDAAMGLQMGSMFGPYGMAAGVIGGAIFGLVKKSIDDAATKNKNAMAAFTDSISLDSTAISSLGIKSQDFSKIVLASTSSIAGSGDAITQTAEAYKAATDEQTQNALAHIKTLVDGGKSADLMAEAQRRYNTELMAGVDSADAAKDTLALLKAGGAGPFALNNISKGFMAKTPEQALTQNLNALGDPKETMKVAGSYFGFGIIASMKNDKTNAQNKVLGDAVGQTLFSAASNMELEKYLTSIKNIKNESVFTKEAFQGFNNEIRKQNPELADLNTKLEASGVDHKNLYIASRLAAEGAFDSANAYLIATKNIDALNLASEKLTLTQLASKETSSWMGWAASKDAKASSPKSSGPSVAQQIAKQKSEWAYQDEVKRRQDQIKSVKDVADAQVKAIQEEMKARNDANSALDKEVQDKRTLSDLANDVKRAEASGDLLSMASAQSAYNEELARQKREQDSIAKDKADQAKIDKINADAEAKITKMQAALDAMQAKKEKADRAQTIKGIKDQAKAQDTITSAVTTTQDAAKTLDDAMWKLIYTGKYSNWQELYNAIISDKGLKGMMDKAGITADQLKGHLMGVVNSFGPDGLKKLRLLLSLNADTITFDELKGNIKVGLVHGGKPLPIGVATGGHITGPGGPTEDAIPAYLSNGEYVIQASSVAKYGKDFFDGVNAGHFAVGGPVDYSIEVNPAAMYNRYIKSKHGSKVSIRRGISMDGSTKEKIASAQDMWGEDFDIVKGGYLPWDPYSLGTHMGGGVFDAYYGNGRDRGTLRHPAKALSALKAAGFAPIQRTTMGSNNIHVHAVEIGNPHLAPDTKAQVARFKKYGKYATGGLAGSISKPSYNTSGAQRSFGVGNSNTNNSAAFNDNKVYNISVSVETNASADDIANKVMKTIERNNRALGTNRTMGGRR